MRWLLADWGRSKRERFDAVVEGLRGLGHDVVRLPRNDMKRRPDLLEAIECGGFDALITWQRFFRMQRDIRGALTRSGIRTVYMDFGFVPHYQSVVFDTEGENATSSWPAMWRNGGIPTPEPEFMAAAERLVEDAAARVARLDCPLGDDSEVPRRPFIFVPLQRTGDSVVKYDSSVNDFGALVRRVLALADDRWFVVIKTHPAAVGVHLWNYRSGSEDGYLLPGIGRLLDKLEPPNPRPRATSSPRARRADTACPVPLA